MYLFQQRHMDYTARLFNIDSSLARQTISVPFRENSPDQQISADLILICASVIFYRYLMQDEGEVGTDGHPLTRLYVQRVPCS